MSPDFNFIFQSLCARTVHGVCMARWPNARREQDSMFTVVALRFQ